MVGACRPGTWAVAGGWSVGAGRGTTGMGLSDAAADVARHPDCRARISPARPVAGAWPPDHQADASRSAALVVRVIPVVGPPLASIEEEVAACDARRARHRPAAGPPPLIDGGRCRLATHRSESQRAT